MKERTTSSYIGDQCGSLIPKVMADPGVHDWVKNQYKASMDRDPVDALNDAKLLAAMLQEQWNLIKMNTVLGDQGGQTNAH